MAQWAVEHKQASIRLACATFSISQSCYYYQPRLNDENAEIADWLLRLTETHKRWGFGLCFMYLRNVKGFGWNHRLMMFGWMCMDASSFVCVQTNHANIHALQ